MIPTSEFHHSRMISSKCRFHSGFTVDHENTFLVQLSQFVAQDLDGLWLWCVAFRIMHQASEKNDWSFRKYHVLKSHHLEEKFQCFPSAEDHCSYRDINFTERTYPIGKEWNGFFCFLEKIGKLLLHLIVHQNYQYLRLELNQFVKSMKLRG